MLIAASAVPADAATTWLICPDSPSGSRCEFKGLPGLQAAVDRSTDGDQIRLRAGEYVPESFRDVPFEKLAIRGAILIDGKRLEIVGEDGAVLDGSRGVAASAIVIRGGHLTIRNLTLKGFRAADSDDDIYDGHGLFFIGAEGDIEDVTIEGIAKMALTERGHSQVRAQRLKILDGHVGIWLEETSHLDLSDATVRNNESAGICAYGQSSAAIAKSRFEANRDDGVYTEKSATIDVSDSEILRNTPYGMRATGDSLITARHIRIEGNAKAETATEGQGRIVVEP